MSEKTSSSNDHPQQDGTPGGSRALKESQSDLEVHRREMTKFMNELLNTNVGGEATEALRLRRAKDPGFFSNISAYWLYTLLSMKGRPFPLLPLIFYAVYCSAVIVFGTEYMADAGDLDSLKTMKPELKDVSQVLGLAVFLVLTFRNNASYQRWYDGATKFYDLCGFVSNAARQVASVTPMPHAMELLWWLFAAMFTAKQQLRASRRVADFTLLERVMPTELWVEIADRHDKFQWCLYRYNKLAVKIDQTGKTATKACEEVMKAVYGILNSYTACWRIMRTPMPFAYLSHLRSFLFIWLALLPWTFVASYGWYSMILCLFVGYGVMGVEESAVEVEMPFGSDYNDLPLDLIARDTLDLLTEFMLVAGFDEEGNSLAVPTSGDKMC